ncbi:MAG: type II toxin-antitoxin system RelE/ParE family toxin [Caulobacter sp.]|nr:type II toxin-antitoxin system RelE/ParE family toxin [Caulobacter sp.]
MRLAARAKHDLSRLETFLITKNPYAARRAVDAIATAVLSPAEHAERGHAGPAPNLRQIPVAFGNSGYVIQYRVSETMVLIARIKHALERP